MEPVSRSVFFSGKGGVGKTSMASAAALAAADRGDRTLLVSTDPASNLDDVFEQAVGPEPTQVPGVERLMVMNVDAEAAAAAYRERALGPLRGILPVEVVRSVEEQMSGPCTVEIAGFDRFIACLGMDGFDLVVFDTAPTGHTLRLLELPGAWSAHIDASASGSGQTCLGPVEALASSKEQYDRAVALLRSPEATVFTLVTQAERTAVEETVRTQRELAELGFQPQVLIVNGLIPPEAVDNAFFQMRRAMQDGRLADLRRTLPGLALIEMPLWDFELRGLEALRKVGGTLGAFHRSVLAP